MTVIAKSGDTAGLLLQANLTLLQTAAAKLSGSALYTAQQKINQHQTELVYHYLDVGRISAATVLSTLS